MIKDIYLFLHHLTLTLIGVFLIFIFTLYHPRFIELLSDSLSKNTVLSFSSIEGSVADGLIFNNINYDNSLYIGKVVLKYNLFDIIFSERKIDKIELVNPLILSRLYTKKSDSKSSSSFMIPDFMIGSIVVKDALIKDSIDYNLSFDLSDFSYKNSAVLVKSIDKLRLHVRSRPDVIVALKAKELKYNSALHVRSVEAKVDVDSNHLDIRGYIKNTKLIADAKLSYKESLTKDIDSLIIDIPRSLKLNILSADFSSISLNTKIDSLKLRDKNISINNSDINASYRYTDSFISLHVSHDINETYNDLHVQHQAVLGFDTNVKDTLHVSIKKSKYSLPFWDIDALIDVNSSSLALNIDANCTKSYIYTKDFNTYELEGVVKDLDLKFLDDIPASLKEYPLSADVNASYILDKNSLSGSLKLLTQHTSYDANITYIANHLSSDGLIKTDANTEFWKSVPLKNIDNIHIITDLNLEKSMLYINSQELHVTLFDRDKKISGWGSLSSSDFTLEGDYGDGKTALNINSNIPSLYTVIDSFYDLKLPKESIFDCELDINSTVIVDKSLHVSTEVSIPWYLAMSDKDNIIYGTDANLSLSIKNGSLWIDNYFVNLFNRDFFATKPSSIYLKDKKVQIDKFWINDGIRVVGTYDLQSEKLLLDANAESYHYKDKDAEADIGLHVRLEKDKNSTSVDGQIKLKNALITYKPVSSSIVTDDDIILIQDVKTPHKTPLSLNIQIISSDTVHYKTKDIDVTFKPDITIYKEPLGEIELLGWLSTDFGRVYNGASEYEIKKSEIYFNGGALNPYLNLHLFYEIDLNEIDIYVTNTLTSPVLLFTSNPPMSQSDIISYLLFGTPANSSFDSDSSNTNGINAANIFLGAGIKQMIGDTTGLRIDTLNLLSKEDGGVGFEVGTRVSHDIRIILKNDDIFSMVLQMNINRNLRLDVDVQETGQGINIIYVKDYEDILKK